MFDIATHSFDIADSFLQKYKGKQPQWGPLGFFVYKRTYARQIEGEDRTEEFWETCRRVVEGTFSIQRNHCKRNRQFWDEKKAQRAARQMFEFMWTFRFLPPGRGLWCMGTDAVLKKGGAALNNCSYISTENIDQDFARPFKFVMDMSMLGVGCGFGTEGANKIIIPEQIANSGRVIAIDDTREAWVDALGELLDCFARGLPVPNFDYSKIRLAGVPIKTFGGTASGPEPLKDLLDNVRLLLGNNIGKPVTSTIIVDIMNMIGKCVVAGNVRRSSELALGHRDDKEFALLKHDKVKLLAHRWASNNSISAEIGMDYSWHAQETAKHGEPGFIWLDNARAYGRMKDPANWIDRDVKGFNPCSEQSLHDAELCTLVETFPARHDSLEEYLETLKIAYLYAKTVTLVPTHNEETNAVMAKNRRIGLSQSGIIKAFGKHGRREMLRWCDKGYEFLNGLDVQYSNWLGIPKSIKKTSVKPSGTVSLLPGEPPGIHYPHSEFYIRRVRVAKDSSLLPMLRKAGYKIEVAVGQETSTCVVEFPIHEEFFERSKDDVSIWEQVHNAIAYQKYWSDNAVSVTVTFKDDEKQDIQHVLELCEDSLKAISFLPLENHGYQQAPYETISKEQYESMTKDLQPLNFVSDTHEITERYCDSDQCQV